MTPTTGTGPEPTDPNDPRDAAPAGDPTPGADTQDAVTQASRRHRPRPSIAWRPLARTGLKVAVVIAVVSVALGVGAAVAVGFYDQYGAVRNEPNARAWAALVPQHVGQALCADCHAGEAIAQDASIHVNVSCESCHGPGERHASGTDAARTIALVKPDSAVCVRCHGATSGRPASFPVVNPASHYSGGACLRCHDPHSIVATRPPIVSHPLADLPECTTCHAPDGLKKVPSGHTMVADPICLSCHSRNADGRH
jgi:hypothetical protein